MTLHLIFFLFFFTEEGVPPANVNGGTPLQENKQNQPNGMDSIPGMFIMCSGTY